MSGRHFLTLMDLQPAELEGIVARAMELKRMLRAGERHEPLRGRTMVLVFEKSSTRTRVSFETGMGQFGGNAIFLAPGDSHLARGEPIEDTARVLSRMVDVIVMRTDAHQRVERMARYAEVPVINALSDDYHPCQLLADMQTFVEHRGTIRGRRVAWIGDGNNVCHSWINAARQFGFHLAVATPEGFEPDPAITRAAGERVTLLRDPAGAAAGADLVVTDTWASMGQEGEKGERARIFAPYRVDTALMAQAAPGALFMHCLPAYRGQEVTEEVLEGPWSVVWDEAENRLHAQKSLLEFLLGGSEG